MKKSKKENWEKRFEQARSVLHQDLADFECLERDMKHARRTGDFFYIEKWIRGAKLAQAALKKVLSL